MKLYLFLKIADSKGVYDNPIVYAFTKDKELANDFCRTRNMKIFYKKEIDVTKTVYNNYLLNYRGHLLTKSSFVTKSNKSFVGYETVCLTVTVFEEETVYINADKTLEELAKYTSADSFMFNENIMNNLNIIKYFDIFKFYSADSQTSYSYFNTIMPSDFNLRVDYLALFLHFYGNTMLI